MPCPGATWYGLKIAAAYESDCVHSRLTCKDRPVFPWKSRQALACASCRTLCKMTIFRLIFVFSPLEYENKWFILVYWTMFAARNSPQHDERWSTALQCNIGHRACFISRDHSQGDHQGYTRLFHIVAVHSHAPATWGSAAEEASAILFFRPYRIHSYYCGSAEVRFLGRVN